MGFPEKTADIRMAQYESGSRTPKADLTNTLAQVFEVSPQALTVPDIDSYIGLMHTLFTLEDIDGELCLTLEKHNKSYVTMFEMLNDWRNQAEKLKNEESPKMNITIGNIITQKRGNNYVSICSRNKER